jgi:glutamine amidotransferase
VFGAADGYIYAVAVAHGGLLWQVRTGGPVYASAALSDGARLFAVRYATDAHAPTLYHRWSNRRQGRAVVSEPLEQDEGDWTEVPAGSFCVFEGADVALRPFEPCPRRLAA